MFIYLWNLAKNTKTERAEKMEKLKQYTLFVEYNRIPLQILSATLPL